MDDIEVASLPDGGLLYRVRGSATGLPPVRRRDLLACWEAARSGAAAGSWGVARCFRFAAAAGPVDIALLDADARAWADAVDARTGLDTRYGLSLCLRLLALVEWLSRPGRARHFVTFAAGEAELNPGLVAAACAAPLDAQAHFDLPHLLAGDARPCDVLPP